SSACPTSSIDALREPGPLAILDRMTADTVVATPMQEIVLAGPRGFCAGVDRAIDIVELALQVCPHPVYVRKEIVHNRHVVEALGAKGAHFVDDTRGCIEALRRRFPKIVGTSKDGICYATQNRQAAVKTVASEVDVLLVIGAANSSNANRLVEVSRVMGTPSHLINDKNDIRPEWFEGARRVGITAGASTPEFL